MSGKKMDTNYHRNDAKPDSRQGTSVLVNFRQLAGDRLVCIHPLVASLIDPEVLKKLKATASAKPISGAAWHRLWNLRGARRSRFRDRRRRSAMRVVNQFGCLERKSQSLCIVHE